MIADPKLSVILPVHNGMPYLPATIESLLSQRFREFELLVLDDDSTDETARYLSTIDDPRLSYHRMPRVGQARAMNRGLILARTDLILRIDADDLALPDRFALQHERMIRDPDLVLLGSAARIIDASGVVREEVRMPTTDEAIRWSLLFTCPFFHPGIAYRRSVVLDLGGYDSSFEPAEDYHLWTRMASRGKLANLPEFLLHYREHGNNITVKKWATSMTNAGKIARLHADSLLNGEEAEGMESLHRFQRFGHPLDWGDLAPLPALHRRLVERFGNERQGQVTELHREIDAVTQQLRWRCLTGARNSLARPRQFARWLRLAGMFDPDQGRVATLIKRRLRALIRGGRASSGPL